MQALMPPIDSSDNLFHNGNPLTGEKGTIVTAEFLNNTQSAIRDTQNEIIAVLTAAGIKPDSATAGQVLSSLKKLFLIRSNPFSDIAADGQAAVSAALKNLGLGDGTSLPFGIPVPWPTNTPPAGWITMSGQTITAAQYPKLYALYGANLPDLRGEFIRGWDNGRGVDSGRILLAFQSFAMQEVTGNMGGFDMNNDGLPNPDGPFRAGARTVNSFPSGGTISMAEVYTSFALSRVAQTALETRPRNIAFNYIVRGI